MSKEPRYFQIEALDYTRAEIEKGTYDGIVKMPTGTGKSRTQNLFTEKLAPIEQYRTIFIGGFKRDLCTQAIEGFIENYPKVSSRIEVNGQMVDGIGLVMERENNVSARIVVCSAQTIANRELTDDTVIENQKVKKSDLLLNEWGGVEKSPLSPRRFLISPRFDEILKYGFPRLWLHDEAHHAPADSTLFIIQQLKEMAKLLKLPPLINVGFTATPMRNDGIAMSSVYSKVFYAYSDRAATEEGYILPVAKAVRVQIVAEEGGGGYRLKAVENWTDRVIQAWEDHGKPRDCSAFFVGPINGMGAIEASKELRRAFQEHGILAVHIDGQNWIDVDGKVKSNKHRKQLYNRIKNREIPVICNFDVIGEGIDLPIIDTVFLLRSVNEVNFTQIMGRARRRFGNQIDALLIDFTGQELVLLLHGTMTGVKKDMLADRTIIVEESNQEDEEDEIITTGMNMRDLSKPGTVQGKDNTYSLHEITRRSKMAWYLAKGGDMSLACARYKKWDEAEGGRGDALLLRSPDWTVADHYGQLLESDYPSDVLEVAGYLQRIYSSFSLWHTRGLPTFTNINGYKVRDQEIVTGDPILIHEEMDEVEGFAALYAEGRIPFYDTSIAAKKGNPWRKGSVSVYQKPLFEALYPGVDVKDISGGQAAQMITYKLCSDIVNTTLKDAEDWVAEMTKKKGIA